MDRNRLLKNKRNQGVKRLLKSFFKKEEKKIPVLPDIQLPEPVLLVKLEEVSIDDDVKEALKAFLNSPAFEKTSKHLTTRLLSMMLKYEVAPEFKSGWLACLRAFRDMPVDSGAVADGEGDVYIDDAEDL